MPVYNSDIADVLNEIADLLEIEGANEYRVRAYRNAARTVSTLPDDVADRVERGQDLTELPDIGEELAAKLQEIVRTGGLKQLQEIRQRVPPALGDMLDIESLGPKRVQALYKELSITSLEELQAAAREGRIAELDGFGEKPQHKILDGIEAAQEAEMRTRIDVAEEYTRPLLPYLRGIEGVERVTVAGSYRRRRATVGDLDVLVVAEDGASVIKRFTAYEDVDEVVSEGETRSTALLRVGLQVDLRVVSEESYGAALVYFTGSKSHNILLRNMALDDGLKVNEYGVFDGDERVAGRSEADVYRVLGLPLIPAELREDQGEIEAARQDALPELLTVEDLRGDLQSRTDASDGHASLREMAMAARSRGYGYLAVTDHSAYIGVTQGLEVDDLAQQMDAIDTLNEELEDILILKGIEVDILEDGELDLDDDILGRLDLVIGAVHSAFDLSREKQTQRIIKAMDNRHLNILAHPTGRRIGTREPYDVDLAKIMEAALQRGCFLEINAHLERLDLRDIHCRMAKERGLKVAISTDAHREAELDHLRFGVDQARRGWLEPDDVLNTRSWPDLRTMLQRD